MGVLKRLRSVQIRLVNIQFWTVHTKPITVVFLIMNKCPQRTQGYGCGSPASIAAHSKRIQNLLKEANANFPIVCDGHRQAWVLGAIMIRSYVRWGFTSFFAVHLVITLLIDVQALSVGDNFPESLKSLIKVRRC